MRRAGQCTWARGRVAVALQVQAPADPTSGDRATAERPRLVVTIDDDGPGLSPEQRRAVLDRGVRLDESVPGSGLGLAIAARVVETHGGRLELRDPPHGGFSVCLLLPAIS